MTADNDNLFLPPFRSLLEYDQFTVSCDPYEGVVGQVLSSLQYADSTDIDWYMSEIGKGTGTVIDLMSGSGRLATMASRAGWQAVAVDNSPDVLEVNRARASDVEFVLGDAWNDQVLQFREPADCVMCGGKSVSLLSPSKRQRLFASISRRLRPGGTFIGDAYATFDDDIRVTDVLPLNLTSGRLLWYSMRSTPSLSTMVSNFLVEPVDPVSSSGYRLLATQRHYGLDAHDLRLELDRAGLDIETLSTVSTPGDFRLPYHRFVARAR